ncbi:uncharacterized protein LOC130738249 isoform X2 [Lotus japonicus]|uniref:uncharacterized protein LOC130738249 isoform X2 n=1 Tax=Lotus japonicus TaxID=34305 RepID=UPI00258644B5|nr:uncharacterized protein LOC130738249 isoform X2 [Lotus japonicus]
MASIAPTCSPTSLQLRWAFNGPKFPVAQRLRLPNHLNPRLLRPLRAAAQTGNGSELSGSGSNAADGFSGWSESAEAEQPNTPKKKESYGGVVGVGVAGILLLTGLTFAASSLGKRTASRPEQQMKALTAQQEALVSSDDHDDEVAEQVRADNKVEQGNGIMEGQIDISSRDYSSPESDNIHSDYRVVDDSDIGSQLIYDKTSNGNDDATEHISVQGDLQHESALDGDLVVSSESPMALESENTLNSFNVFGFRDVDSNPSLDAAESTADVKEINVEPGNMPNNDAKPLHVDNEQQDEITSSDGSRSSSNETEIANIMVSSEGNKSSFKEENIPGNDLFGKSLDSSSTNSLENEVRNDINEINKVRSESPISGSLFSAPGIPAPSVVSTALHVLPGKVLVPAAVDQVQGQALAALQVLKVIEPDVQPGDLCTRREYARWLVSASSALSRSTISKVYPAMYIGNVTELAFDDITPEDPDFSSIQGLAEAGLIESRLSRRDIQLPSDEDDSPVYFSPESPLSRQDLVSWKMALEKRQLPEADRKMLYQLSGFIDTDKIHPNACPALVADLSARDQGIIALAFGYTRLFQPDKPVTKAQAAIALATGDASDIVSEELARIEAESMAENAVTAHSALVAQVEKDINASFEQELLMEREKIDTIERMAEETRLELERLRAEREEDNVALVKERAAIESEMEVFSKLRHEVQDELESLMNNKVEIAYEKERIRKLREQAEVENSEIARLQYELEVERKALSMARAWAEDEAKRVREQARALEEARDRWERHGIKVVVDDDLRKEASAEVTWLNAGEQFSAQGTVGRAESLLDKLKKMGADIRGKSRDIIDKIIHIISLYISKMREWASKTGKQTEELGEAVISKAGKSATELQQSALEFGFTIKEGAKRVAGDCREGVEKITQKFKT